MSIVPIHLTRLALTNFRNHVDLQLNVGPAPVVLTGPNGVGKTNILEAISLLAPGRGLRGATLAEMARSGAGPDFAVATHLASPENLVAIGTGVVASSPGKRQVRINGAPASITDLPQRLTVTWLSPAQDRLFIEGGQERRRFLDRLTLALFPDHAGHVARYEHAARERMKLLAGETAADPLWLTALEARIAEHGVAAAAARRETVLALQPHIDAQTLGGSAFPRAAIAVVGDLENLLAKGLPALAVEDVAKGALASRRVQDMASGRTGYGPQRSDLIVTHVPNGQSADRCSTGEQKALLVAIMLAHTALLAAHYRRSPIVLLDEIAAHLDADRRKGLYEIILTLGTQMWLAGTDVDMFQPLGQQAQFIDVRDIIPAGH